MKPKEIIQRVIAFDHPPRIGMRFLAPDYPNDIHILPGLRLVGQKSVESQWGDHAALKQQVPGFSGQVRQDEYGNIWGRLDEYTKGECIWGILEDDWSLLDGFSLPELDAESVSYIRDDASRHPDLYNLALLPGMAFTLMRNMRKMENFLADVLLNEDEVICLRDRVTAHLLAWVDAYAAAGADGIYAGEDWGTQTALLISPASWRKIFKPCFAAIADRIHSYGKQFILHSCGHIYKIIEDLLEIGVDCFQFDQPELMGLERIAAEFGGRVAFWSPVDIQKVMPTADRQQIEQEARLMVRLLGGSGGGLIAADYTDWQSIDVRETWADWARKVFLAEGWYDGQKAL